jgi:hypothetical protein
MRDTESLNLDHPDFNSKREQLYHDIAEDVKAHEALPEDSQSRIDIRVRMERRLATNGLRFVIQRPCLSIPDCSFRCFIFSFCEHRE